jgi:hypothetical protein
MFITEPGFRLSNLNSNDLNKKLPASIASIEMGSVEFMSSGPFSIQGSTIFSKSFIASI